jgi:hypothetical protein
LRSSVTQIKSAQYRIFIWASLGLLQSIYSNPTEPVARRMRAAIAALRFETPKLAVTALMNGEEFGAALERAIARSGKVIDRSPPKQT